MASVGCSDFRLPPSSHGEYMVSSGSCVVPTCQMHQCESTGALWWTMFRTHTTRQGLAPPPYVSLVEAYFGIQPDAWLTDSFFQQVHAGSSYANPTQDLTSAVTRGVDHAAQIDKGVNHFNMSICHLESWTVEQGMDGESRVFWFSTSLSEDQRPPPLPALL